MSISSWKVDVHNSNTNMNKQQKSDTGVAGFNLFKG